MIAWFREQNPPHSHKQLPPLEKIEDDELMSQTTESISAYICHLPEREAVALLSAWETASATNHEAMPIATPPLQMQTNKLRRNILDVAIDEAISQAGNTNTADVYLHLKDLALGERPPFNGATNNGVLLYTDNNDQVKEFTKNALGKRLKRRQSKPLMDVK